MAAYQAFTSTRNTRPDLVGLLAALRASVAAEVGITFADEQQHYTLKKATAWLSADIAAAQTVLDTYVTATPQILAQREIDALPIWAKAEALTLVDQINILRGALRGLGVSGLPDVTPTQAIAAIRTKAGTL